MRYDLVPWKDHEDALSNVALSHLQCDDGGHRCGIPAYRNNRLSIWERLLLGFSLEQVLDLSVPGESVHFVQPVKAATLTTFIEHALAGIDSIRRHHRNLPTRLTRPSRCRPAHATAQEDCTPYRFLLTPAVSILDTARWHP
jgi:hypothetical protein